MIGPLRDLTCPTEKALTFAQSVLFLLFELVDKLFSLLKAGHKAQSQAPATAYHGRPLDERSRAIRVWLAE